MQQYQAFQFGLSQPQANRWIPRPLDWLWQTRAHIKELPARSDQALRAVLAKEVEVRLDGTEHPIQGCRYYQTQKKHFSGKKAHPVKNNLLPTPPLRMLSLRETYAGCIHDKTIVDEQFTAFPAGIILHQRRIRLLIGASR